MKKRLFALLLAASLVVPAAFAEQTLAAEPNHTTVGFAIPIAGLTRVTGKFTEFQIDVRWDGEGPAEEAVISWKIAATIQAASIDTGIDARDRHLRQEDFFDAEKYPEIRFVSQSVERQGDGYVAVGELTLHGVTRPFRLPFEITGTQRNNVTGAVVIGIRARTSLSRKDYDLASDFQHTHMDNFLGDEVTIEIDTWIQPPKEEEKS